MFANTPTYLRLRPTQPRAESDSAAFTLEYLAAGWPWADYVSYWREIFTVEGARGQLEPTPAARLVGELTGAEP